MAKNKTNEIDDDVIDDDDNWDDQVDDGEGLTAKFNSKLNAHARRLYDQYQDERRLRALLCDGFDN